MSIRVSIRKRLSRSFTLEMEFENSGDGGSACLGILGASGCGKSMTLKCIAGIETPDEGHISVNGRVLFDSAKNINLRPQVRRVGYLFQNYALFPRMTVLENITAGLPGRERAAGKRRKALDWMEQFGLAGLENRRPAQLSGGQQQRAALARMLIAGPEAVLLDEPFSALDTNLRESMQIRMLELLENRGDTILVTHSRDEVFKLCGELLTMDGGRVLKKGPTGELFRSPGLVEVARLTGCKNISPIRRTGERELAALDWGLTLRTAVPVEDGITHVGIRAHDFVPVFSGNEGNAPKAGDDPVPANLIPIKVLSRSREPFEEVVLFTGADTGGRGVLWWKYSKYLELPGLPPCLCAPPERLLLLR
ncbi:MAG: ATP-binding cassette domain-containing protein [Treponema sp.]|nr:ATP-binding cassette domain-containing protein [Treponema sp.]